MKWFFTRRRPAPARGGRFATCAVCGHDVLRGAPTVRVGALVAHAACASYRRGRAAERI